MNHLKHVLSLSVPRRVPSNAAVVTRCCYQAEPCPERGSSRAEVRDKNGEGPRGRRAEGRVVARRNNAVYWHRVSSKCGQAVQPKRFSAGKKLSAESVRRATPRRYSHGRALKSGCIGVDGAGCRERRGERLDRERGRDSGRGQIRERPLPLAPHEKESRSYAEMIADYSEATRVSAASAVLQESLSVDHGMRRSPFSTLSVATVEPEEDPVSDRDLRVEASEVTDVEGRFLKNSRGRSEITTFQNAESELPAPLREVRDSPTSYANMIASYSDGMEFGSESATWRDDSGKCSTTHRPAGNASAASAAGKKVRRLATEMISSGRPADAPGHVESRKQTDWLKKVESIIAELKRAAIRTDVDGAKHASGVPEAGAERSCAKTEKRTSGNSPREERLPDPEGGYRSNESRSPGLSSPREDKLQVCKSGNKSSNPPASPNQSVNRGPGSKPRKDASKTSGVASQVQEEPRVELRMTPSENESVVSVNVNKVPRSPGRFPGDGKELSITIRSRKSTGTAPGSPTQPSGGATASSGARSELGSMHISISEESVPVKQIEFSVNGKPVSELKRIIARSEKLDVVSSSDRIEVRIPIAREAGRVGQKHGKPFPKPARHSDSVLSLRIAARIDEKLADPGSAYGDRRQEGAARKSPEVPRGEQIFKDNARGKGNAWSARVSSEPTVSDAVKVVGLPSGTKIYTSESIKNEMLSGSNEINNKSAAKSGDSNSKRAEAKSKNEKENPPRGSVNVGNANKPSSGNERTPSNMIPWWSSEDAFNRITRKRSTKKTKSAPAAGKLASVFRQEKLAPKLSDSSLQGARNKDQAREDRSASSSRTNVETSRVGAEEGNKNAGTKSIPGDGEPGQENRGVDGSRKECRPGRNLDGKGNRSESTVNKETTGEAKSEAKTKKSSEDPPPPELKLKRILESMKPIEKRPDGTLIDYGIKVSSRRKLEPRRSESEAQGKPLDSFSPGNQEAAPRGKGVPDEAKEQKNKKPVNLSPLSPSKTSAPGKSVNKKENAKNDSVVKMPKLLVEVRPRSSDKSAKMSDERSLKEDKDLNSTSAQSSDLKSELTKQAERGSLNKTNDAPLKPTVSKTSQDQSPITKSKPRTFEQGKNEKKALSTQEKDKGTSTTTPLPLKGTVIGTSKGPKGKPERTDNPALAGKSTRDSSNTRKKEASTTGTAPLAGTVIERSSMKPNRVTTDDGSSKEHPERGKDRLKSPGISGKGKTGSKLEGGNVPTGPAGLKSANSGKDSAPGLNRRSSAKLENKPDSLVKPTGSKTINDTKKMHLNTRVDQTINRNIVSFVASPADRPEKEIFYSVWLRRFKNESNAEKTY